MSANSPPRTYKGLLIEERRLRGQWRFRVSKPAGLPVTAGDEEVSIWYSTPYTDRDFGLEQVKALIDAGGLR